MQDPISRSAGVERETHSGGLVPSQCHAATRPDVVPFPGASPSPCLLRPAIESMPHTPIRGRNPRPAHPLDFRNSPNLLYTLSRPALSAVR